MDAFALRRFRALLSINQLTIVASAIYAAALAGLVLIPSPVAAVLQLLPAGAAWITVISEVNATLQLLLPAWVRARGLSIYQMVLFGSQGAGALVWGLLAGPAGLRTTFLVAAAVLLAGAATVRFWPFADTTGMDRSQVAPWPEPQLAVAPGESEGSVLVMMCVVNSCSVTSSGRRPAVLAEDPTEQHRLAPGDGVAASDRVGDGRRAGRTRSTGLRLPQDPRRGRVRVFNRGVRPILALAPEPGGYELPGRSGTRLRVWVPPPSTGPPDERHLSAAEELLERGVPIKVVARDNGMVARAIYRGLETFEPTDDFDVPEPMQDAPAAAQDRETGG